MTDAAAPAPSPWLDIAKAAIPSLGQCLVILVTFLTAIATTLVTQYVTKPPLVIEAADKPRPSPIVSLSDVDRSLEIHCGEVRVDTQAILKLLQPKKQTPLR